MADQRAQRRQDSNIGGGKGSDREIAGASTGRLLRQPASVIDAAEDIAGLAQEDAAGVRQGDVVATAIEKRHANLAFQLADLLAERWLRRMQPCRSTREVQLLGDRHEIAQMPQFHPHRLDGMPENGNPHGHG